MPARPVPWMGLGWQCIGMRTNTWQSEVRQNVREKIADIILDGSNKSHLIMNGLYEARYEDIMTTRQEKVKILILFSEKKTLKVNYSYSVLV